MEEANNPFLSHMGVPVAAVVVAKFETELNGQAPPLEPHALPASPNVLFAAH